MNSSLISLAQQLNALLIGLGGAFLAMIAIVTALSSEQMQGKSKVKYRAKKDFLQAGICLVICALAGILCMGAIAANAIPIGPDGEMVGSFPREILLFDISLVFVYLCCIGLLESLRFLEIVLSDEIEKGLSLSRLAQWVFLMLLCINAAGSIYFHCRNGYLAGPLPVLVFIGGPIAVALLSALATQGRRETDLKMPIAPVPPSANLQVLCTGLTLALFYQALHFKPFPAEIVMPFCLTMILGVAVSSLFTANRPILQAEMERP